MGMGMGMHRLMGWSCIGAAMYDVTVEVDKGVSTVAVKGSTCTCPVAPRDGAKHCKHVAAVLLHIAQARSVTPNDTGSATRPPPLTSSSKTNPTAPSGDKNLPRVDRPDSASAPSAAATVRPRVLPAFLTKTRATAKDATAEKPARSKKRTAADTAEAGRAKRARDAPAPHPNGDALLRWAVSYVAAHNAGDAAASGITGATPNTAATQVPVVASSTPPLRAAESYTSEQMSACANDVSDSDARSSTRTSTASNKKADPTSRMTEVLLSAKGNAGSDKKTNLSTNVPGVSSANGSACSAAGVGSQLPQDAHTSQGRYTSTAAASATSVVSAPSRDQQPRASAANVGNAPRRKPPVSVDREAIKKRQMAILDEFL